MKLTAEERDFLMYDYFKKYNTKNMFKILFKEKELENIIHFMNQNSNGHEIEVYIPSFFNTVEFENRQFKLTLKTIPYPIQTLIISQISVTPTSQGLGSGLINEIIKYAKKVGFDRLVMESVLTEEGISLAKKKSFEKVYRYEESIKQFPDAPDDYELLLKYDFNEIIRVKIKQLMLEHNMNSYRVGKIIQDRYGSVFQSTLSEILNQRTKNPRLSTIEYITEAIGIPIHQFFQDWKFHYYRYCNRSLVKNDESITKF